MVDRGTLTTSTRSKTGGNIVITLQPKGILLMNDGNKPNTGSKILTLAEEAGTGGTITIEAPEGFVISNGRGKDNDVLASANRGRGGIINAPPKERVLGFIESNIPTPLSDFTAGSVSGSSGLVIFEPSQDKQPEETLLVDISDPQIAQGCRALRARADEDKFIVTGRGGLPLNPKEALSSDAVQVDLVTRDPENRSSSKIPTRSTRSASEPIVEAQGWIVDRDGTVVLVAHAPNAPQHLSQPRVDCVEPQSSNFQ
ncbi:MAG: S-layer family protein [Leptolyngbyaceae cyanobacterium RU_5_1]|nr:S-layer family protein [Leptolyngbyaceae cyanobacterium RU_5_1]